MISRSQGPNWECEGEVGRKGGRKLGATNSFTMNYGGACESPMRRQRGEQKGGDLDYRILEDLRFLTCSFFTFLLTRFLSKMVPNRMKHVLVPDKNGNPINAAALGD